MRAAGPHGPEDVHQGVRCLGDLSVWPGGVGAGGQLSGRVAGQARRAQVTGGQQAWENVPAQEGEAL